MAIFSPLKTAYRKLIDIHATATNAAPMLKLAFLSYYANARATAMTLKNIRAGWRALGLWPINVAKPLLSPFLLLKA